MTRLLPFLVLAACDVPTTNAPVRFTAATQAPVVASLDVGITTPVPGESMGIWVFGATPGSTVGIIAGLAEGDGACPPAWDGLCFGIAEAAVLGVTTADDAGEGIVFVEVPAGLTEGQVVHVQLFELAGPNTVASRVATHPVSAPLEIIGDYVDDFGGDHVIRHEAWRNFGTFSLLYFSNDDNRAVAYNGPDTFTPDAFSTFDWVDVGGQRYYCQTRFDAPTFVDALNAAVPDASSPTTGGCGDFNFPWSELTPAP